MAYHLIVTIPMFLLIHAGLALVFKKAGISWWKGLVPLYNVYVWLELLRKPKWWMIFYVIPVLNFVMSIGIILELVRCFGKNKFIDHALAVLFPYIYFLYLGLNKKDQYMGYWKDLPGNNKKQGQVREWLDAILFAGTAALLIRTLAVEAFMIPTTSMEGSLLAGDFLFVSKFHYGVRMPMAPLSVPFVHNSLPLAPNTKSYLNWVKFPYSRFPGFEEVERNDIVVFNYPDDDINPDVPGLGRIDITSMKQNYIKRCVAVGGDLLEIKDGVVHIDGKPGWQPENLQTSYYVSGIGLSRLEKEGFRFGTPTNDNIIPLQDGSPKMVNLWEIHATKERIEKLRAMPGIAVVPKIDSIPNTPQQRLMRMQQDKYLLSGNPLNAEMRAPLPKYTIFPRNPDKYLWTIDNFGPVWIPQKGATVPLNDSTLVFYRKCIEVYEDNTLEYQNGQYLLNGSPASSYTFKMNYYWMMGDNRHQSLDSRYWGFVPEDHIIGRPWFVLFSMEGGPRMDRFLKPATKWEP